MVDRLSDDQLRSIKDAVTVLIDAEFASIPEVQRVASSLRDLLNQVDVYLTSPSQEADEEVKHDKARQQCTFYFIDADKLRAEGDTFDRMPEFGTLQQMGGWLVQKAIEIPRGSHGCLRGRHAGREPLVGIKVAPGHDRGTVEEHSEVHEHRARLPCVIGKLAKEFLFQPHTNSRMSHTFTMTVLSEAWLPSHWTRGRGRPASCGKLRVHPCRRVCLQTMSGRNGNTARSS